MASLFLPTVLSAVGRLQQLQSGDGLLVPLLVVGAGDGGTPTATTVRGAAAAGTDVPGANLTIDASNGTGTGGSGSLIFRTGAAAGTGSSANTLSAVLTLGPAGNAALGIGLDTTIFWKVSTTTLLATSYTGNRSSLAVAPASDPGANVLYTGGLFLCSSSGATVFSAAGVTLRGGDFSAQHGGSGILTVLNGSIFKAQKSSTGPVTTAIAVDTQLLNSNATGAITTGIGLRVFLPTLTGAITTVEGIEIRNQGGANATSVAGIVVDAQSGATNNTGLLLGTRSIPSGSWGIYNISTNASYHAGNLGLGTTAFTAASLLHPLLTNATTAAVDAILTVGHNSSGTPAAGFGGGLGFQLHSSTTTNQDVGRLRYEWATATHASRKARATWSVYDTAEREGFRIEADGSSPLVGFLGAAAVARQTSGANLTNNVTAGGTTDQIDDFGSLAVYATDAAAIRNDIYQLARKLKQVNDALRLYGLLT